MSFLDLCEKRCSLRAYADKAVPRDAVDRCIEAARLAPSACNSQPWTFMVVDAEPLRSALAKHAFGGIYSMNAFAAEAPVMIVLVRERMKYAAAVGAMVRNLDYSLIDIGIAGEHLCLQAVEEGLGTCWLGWFNEKAVKKVLGLPRKAKVDILISLGYPANGWEPRGKKRKSTEDMSKRA